MITEELKAKIPALDPAARWCRGLGKPEWIVSVGRMRGGKFRPLPEMDFAGGGIRLCSACVAASKEQARGHGLTVRVVDSAEFGLTLKHAML